MTFFGFLYDIALHLYACYSLPKLLFQAKYKRTLLKRLGIGFPIIKKKERKLVWIHAVSFGETKAILPLIKKLKNLQNAPLIILSSATHTGHIEGVKNAPLADFHVYMPFDFSYIIRPIIKRTLPDLVILTETDFWFHFQDASQKKGAKLLVINGKISERSFNRLAKFPYLTRHLLNPIDHFYLQADVYQKRFEKLNIPRIKMTVTGNLKLDGEAEFYDAIAFKRELGLDSQMILTLGSTHDPEEKLWIQALKKLWDEFPNLKVLMVPRHPERFEEVAKLLTLEKIPFSRLSQNGHLQHKCLLLVDAMGILRKCYQISDLAFVGGSFNPEIGGHNILEPAFYGKPVLFGPYMHSQPDFLELVNTFQAGFQLTQETLISVTRSLIQDPALCRQLGSNGQKLILSARGALDHLFNALLPLLQNNTI